jgi:hypothetical protein
MFKTIVASLFAVAAIPVLASPAQPAHPSKLLATKVTSTTGLKHHTLVHHKTAHKTLVTVHSKHHVLHSKHHLTTKLAHVK